MDAAAQRSRRGVFWAEGGVFGVSIHAHAHPENDDVVVVVVVLLVVYVGNDIPPLGLRRGRSPQGPRANESLITIGLIAHPLLGGGRGGRSPAALLIRPQP